MKIMIASEFRCHVYQNEYYLSSKAYSIYKRYADAFGKIVLCSRFVPVDELPRGLTKVDFIVDTVPINGLFQTLLGKFNKSIAAKMESCDLVIGRLPSVTAYKASDIAKRKGIPYIAELMCDGWDPYWNHGIKGKLIAPFMHLKLKQVAARADYAVYVTETFLQRRYPCKNPSIHASNVLIKPVDASVMENRLQKIANMDPNPTEISVMTTANVNLISKGQHYVVRAMGELKKQGIIVKYHLAGAGDQTHLKNEAAKADVSDQLVFLGELTLDEVYEWLDQTDIYVQPSLQEGLPRAVIEAMSRGCPCIGANTAGIPELLDSECIVKKASSKEIAVVIQQMLSKGLKDYAVKNYAHSQDYSEKILNERRNRYFAGIVAKIESKNQ